MRTGWMRARGAIIAIANFESTAISGFYQLYNLKSTFKVDYILKLEWAESESLRDFRHGLRTRDSPERPTLFLVCSVLSGASKRSEESGEVAAEQYGRGLEGALRARW